MKNRKEKRKLKTGVIIGITVLLIALILIFLFFNKKVAKNISIGNNSTSQEIVDYILNLSSYETTVEVEIESNKNKNKYVIKQIYNSEGEIQEIIEPSNISGVKLIKTGNTLKMENSNLNLVSIFENYEGIGNNDLDLSCFVKDFKESESANWEEKNGIIEMRLDRKNNLKTQKILYINRESGNPEKMEIKDANQNRTIYILYREAIINR